MTRVRFDLLMLALLCMGATNAHAIEDDATGDASLPFSDRLLGDVGGLRTTLANDGVDVTLHYSGDVWDVVSGGKKRIATYLDYTELRANIDGEKLFGIAGNSMSIAFTNSNGTRTNGSTVGSIQGIDNSEVASNGVRLYEAWVQQNFLADQISLRLGVQDLNVDSEFSATPISDNFLQPGMQLGQSFAGSGRNGPPSFPYDSAGARVRVKPTDESYVAVAAYDGIPGEAGTVSGDPVRFDRKDGVLFVGEAGISPEAEGGGDGVNKLAVGVWHYTGGVPEQINPALEGTAEGVYALSSYRFYHDAQDRNLGAFLRGGAAADATAETDWDLEAGLVANGFMPTRPDSEIGAGLALAHNGNAYMQAQDAAGTPARRLETAYEVYYRDKVAQGIVLQPDMQYIVHPGTDPQLDNAFVVGARLDVMF